MRCRRASGLVGREPGLRHDFVSGSAASSLAKPMLEIASPVHLRLPGASDEKAERLVHTQAVDIMQSSRSARFTKGVRPIVDKSRYDACCSFLDSPFEGVIAEAGLLEVF
jgi:hypothetical protein